MEYVGIIGILFSLTCSIVAIAVAWGRSSANSEETQRWRADMEKKLEKFVTKENDDLKHGYLEDVVKEINTQLRDIQDILWEMQGKKINLK